MRNWTAEAKQRQAELIRRWQPWKTAGVKTAAGKAITRLNALKHGRRSAQIKKLHRYFALCRARLKAVEGWRKARLELLRYYAERPALAMAMPHSHEQNVPRNPPHGTLRLAI